MRQFNFAANDLTITADKLHIVAEPEAVNPLRCGASRPGRRTTKRRRRRRRTTAGALRQSPEQRQRCAGAAAAAAVIASLPPPRRMQLLANIAVSVFPPSLSRPLSRSLLSLHSTFPFLVLHPNFLVDLRK